MTAPIFLNVPEARAYFLAHGEVYTLRKPRGTGFTRARHGGLYEFDDLGKVEVLLISLHPSRETLERFLPRSGFASVDDWLAAAKHATVLYVVRKKT